MSKLTFDEQAEIAGIQEAEKSFRIKMFAKALSIGGELIEKEKKQWVIDRINKCRSCEYFGKVTADGLLKETDGCLDCGCPMITKPFYKSHPLGATCQKGYWDEIDSKYK
jgi:hypothetical protein